MKETFSVILKMGDAWIHFENPSEIIAANKKEDVFPALQKLDGFIEDSKPIAGFISYEAAAGLDNALSHHETDFPLLKFGVFEKWKNLSEPGGENKKVNAGRWRFLKEKKNFVKDVQKIKEYIASGDTYQVNYTVRMESDFTGDPFEYFKFLAENQQAAYAGFVSDSDFSICSASPELFFSLENESLISQPMKGTAARGLWHEDDKIKGNSLKNSEKDQAENLMITDMIRNDMGKVCNPGSVKTRHIFSVRRLPTVWQMTSEVTGKCSANFSDIIKALFPCASITGAPKARTMQIIKELEETPRKIYTGSMGYFLPGRRAQFNVAIRTVLINKIDNKAEYGVGSGIVWDSHPGKEYDECKVKALVLKKRPQNFELIETILLEMGDFFLFDYHIKRLQNSAEYFGFDLSLKKVKNVCEQIRMLQKNRFYKVRILVNKKGEIKSDISDIDETGKGKKLNIGFSDSSINSDNPFLYHKTTVRKIYENARKEAIQKEWDDVILWNKKGEITETTVCNVVIKLGESYFTPPIKCGLLPGIFRQYLLDNGEISEKILKKEDILEADEIYLINSVRKWQKAIIVSDKRS
ncbi:MAG: aminodeoxychorismate synthase component I [Calditrichaeota bacterium]|nr:aminodeoxychorismate synthase component I [Calditrichota bacterium]